MKLSGKALVVQLTRDYIRIAKMALGSKAQILEKLQLETPAGAVDDGAILDMEALRDVIAPALAAPEFKGTKRVVFALMTTQVMSERVAVPALTGQKLDKLLEVNMDMYFPVEISDHQITRQEIGYGTDESGEKTLLLQMWATPKEMLRKYYELAAACGLTVAAIDYCGNSMAAVAGASFAEPKPKGKAGRPANKAGESEQEEIPVEAVQVYMLAEADQFVMTFVQNGQVVMQRSFLCIQDIDMALSEAMMVLDYYRSMIDEADQPMEIFVCGGLAEEPEFEEQASAALGIPVQFMVEDYTPAWCICAGAARTALDFGGADLAGKKATKEKIDVIWHLVALMAGAAVLILVCMIHFGSKGSWDSEIKALEDREMELRIQAAQSRKAADAYDEYSAQYQKFSSDWDMIFSSLRTYNDNLVLILEEIEQLLPSESKVTAIDILSEGLTVQFSCSDKEETAYLIMALREMKYADLTYISNIKGTTGKVGGTEAPPTEGSSDFATLMQQAIASGQLTQAEISAIFSNLTPEQQAKVLSGTLSEQEAMQIVMSLPADQQQKLMNIYLQNGAGGGTTNPTNPNTPTNYDAEELINKATLDQRKESISTMLTEEPTATYRFFELFLEDIGREPRTTTVYETVSDDLWRNPKLMSAFLSGDPMEIYAALPDLIEVLTKNERSVAGTEKLCIDGGLGSTYAKHLARAMGLDKQPTPNPGPGGFDPGTLFPPTGGNTYPGGNNQAPVQDNRIHFVVNLDYNENLMNAELERKGFSNEGKPAMLEVEG